MRKQCKLELAELLSDRIPITKFMGLSIDGYDGVTLSLKAPFEPNRNVHNTGFAGSLFSLAALAAWGLLFIKLREGGCDPHIVVAKSSITYRHPVMDDMTATSSIADASKLDDVLKTVARREQAQMVLDSAIYDGHRVAAEFTGTFIIRKGSANQ